MDKTNNENKKSYKKPLVLGAIAVLLTLIGVTGGNTYAKYVTSKEAQSTTATVAKWGYVISADASNLFAKEYGVDATPNVMVAKDKGTGIVASGTDAVVAPGSKGSATITVTGTAEVAAQLTINVTIDSEVSYGDYKPVNWTLKGAGKTWIYDATDKRFEDENGKNTIDIAAKEDLTGDKAMSFELSWEWAFEASEEADKAKNNAYDTILGYRATVVDGNDTSLADAKKAAEAVSYVNSEKNVEKPYNEENFVNAKTTLGVTMSATIEQVAK